MKSAFLQTVQLGLKSLLLQKMRAGLAALGLLVGELEQVHAEGVLGRLPDLVPGGLEDLLGVLLVEAVAVGLLATGDGLQHGAYSPFEEIRLSLCAGG